MNDKPQQTPAPRTGPPAGAGSSREADRDAEPMDDDKARKALRKIAEVEEKLEPRG